MQIKNLKTAGNNSHAVPAMSLPKKKPIRNQAWIEKGLQREPTFTAELFANEARAGVGWGTIVASHCEPTCPSTRLQWIIPIQGSL